MRVESAYGFVVRVNGQPARLTDWPIRSGSQCWKCSCASSLLAGIVGSYYMPTGER